MFSKYALRLLTPNHAWHNSTHEASVVLRHMKQLSLPTQALLQVLDVKRHNTPHNPWSCLAKSTLVR